MKTNIDNFVIMPFNGGLNVTLDQRHDAKRGIKLILVMLVCGLIVAPYGPFPIEGLPPVIFYFWIIGWSISGLLTWNILNWRQEYLFTRHKLSITEIKNGVRLLPRIIKIDKQLMVTVRRNRGNNSGEHGRSPAIFPYTIIVEGEAEEKTTFSMLSQTSVKDLLSAIETIVPLSPISEETSPSSVVVPIIKFLKKGKKS